MGTRCLAHFPDIRSGELPRVTRRGRFLTLALAAILTACSPAAAPTPGAPFSPAVLEIAEVVPAGTPNAQSIPNFDSAQPDVLVVDITPCAVESAKAKLVQNSFGRLDGSAYTADDPMPAAEKVHCIEFAVAEKDRLTFHAWTEARVGRTMAVLIDRKAVTVARLTSALPGVGLCEFRASGTTMQTVEDMAARLVVPR